MKETEITKRMTSVAAKAAQRLALLNSNPTHYLVATYVDERENQLSVSGLEAITELEIRLQDLQLECAIALREIQNVRNTLKDGRE